MVEHLKLPSILTATPDKVASDIIDGIAKSRNVIYTLAIWRWIMIIIKLIPEFIFKRLKF